MTTIEVMITRLDRLPVVTAEQMLRAMNASLIAIEGDARQAVPQDTRKLAGSINARPPAVSAEGGIVSVVGRVGPQLKYGIPVERGRRAGAKAPPVDALIPWVRRHWFAPLVGNQMVLPGQPGYGEHGLERYTQATNRRFAKRGTPEKALRRRAFILARAIKRRGIPRQPYMRQAYDKNRRQIYENFVGVGASIVVALQGGRR